METTEILTYAKDVTAVIPVRVSDETFTSVYENYYKRVYNFIAYRLCNNRQMTEDLVSQIFERIIVNYSNFDETKGNLDVWIFTVARNTMYDHFRRQKLRNSLPLDNLRGFAEDKPSPDRIVLQNEESRFLAKALVKLSEKERSIVSMKFGSQLKNTEIAEIMGLKESNIGVILHRALKKMKKELLKGGFEFSE